jgi:hypothetical protein
MNEQQIQNNRDAAYWALAAYSSALSYVEYTKEQKREMLLELIEAVI